MSRDDVLPRIEAVYSERFERFYRVAFAIVRDRETAWDAVQDGFAAAIRGRDGFRGEAPIELWLWRIVMNRAFAVAARAQTAELAVDDLPLEQPHEHVLPGDMAAAVGGLPPRQRLGARAHDCPGRDEALTFDNLVKEAPPSPGTEPG